MKHVAFVFVLLLTLLPSSGRAQNEVTLAITSPAPRTVVSPGQTINVTVSGTNLPADGIETVIGSDPIAPIRGQKPGQNLVFTLNIPSDIEMGPYSVTAAVSSATGIISSLPVTIIVQPQTILQSLKVNNAHMVFYGQGRSSDLEVQGQSATKTVFLDNATLSFESSNPSVASVSASGIVTANSAGTAQITCTYASVPAIGQLAITATAQVKVVVSAAATAANMALATPPILSPAGGTYNVSQSIALTNTSYGATIYYTLDGTTPTTQSAVYTTPIILASTSTVNAIAGGAGYVSSAVASATYTINSPVAQTAATPTFSPAAGTFTAVQSVTISDATAGASIYYTTDGTTPTASSTPDSGPIMVSSTETIQAIAVASGYTNSPVASATYTINLPKTSR